MGEPSGGADESGPAIAGAVPEGHGLDEGAPRGAAQRLGMPPFPGQSKPADSLDLFVSLDEPISLIHTLGRIADERASAKEWKVIAYGLRQIAAALARLQEPAARTGGVAEPEEGPSDL